MANYTSTNGTINKVQKNMATIGSVLVYVFLFLPFLKFTSENEYASANVGVNGFQTLFGKYGSIIAVIMLLAPIAVILTNYIAQLKPFRRTICVGFPLLAAVFEIITLFRVKSAYMKAVGDLSGSADFSCKPQIGFFLLLILYLAIAVISFKNAEKGEKDRF